ncbi:MAG: AI-2E family transporter [Pseudomonadota bacterium]
METVSLPKPPKGGLSAVFYSAALFVLGGYVLYIGQGVIIPMVIAVFLSFLIVTVKRQFERVPKIGHLLPEAVTFALAFGVIVLVLFILVAIVRNNVGIVATAVPAYTERLSEIWQNINMLEVDLPFMDDVSSSLDNIRSSALGVVQGALTNLASAAGGFLGGLTTVVLYTAFMLLERGRFLKKIVTIAGPEGGARIVSGVLDDLGRLIREYISVKTSTSLLTGAISWAIMFALGIDFAGFWALIIFALNYIPVIGSIIGVILPTVLALVQPGGGVTLFLLSAVLLTGAQQLVGSFIEPRMMGKSLNLSPLVILLSLAAWGSLWGIAGMFLCVPMTVVLMIVLAQFESTRAVAVLLSDDGSITSLAQSNASDGAAHSA